MKKIVPLIVVSLFLSFSVWAQKGKVAGKVSNSRNEGLAGVTIKIGGDGTGFTKTDVDGQFSFSADFGKKYSVTLSYIGYKDKTIDDITITTAKEEEILNIILEEGGKALESVTVTSSSRGSAKGETINALISYQKNTSTVAQVISAEAIRRSPDKNTGEVLKRVPGTSVQEGKCFPVWFGAAQQDAVQHGLVITVRQPANNQVFSFLYRSSWYTF